MKTAYPDALLKGELDFEVDILNKKYTYRFYKNGEWEALRHGESWLEGWNVPGAKMWLAMASELDELKTGSHPETARAVAERAITEAKIPKAGDGVHPLPVPAQRVLDIAARAVTIDRDRGRLDYAAIADFVVKDAPWESDEIPAFKLTTGLVKNMIVNALNYAQSSGARFVAGMTASEDDYAEAVAAACEAFATTFKAKGLV